MARRLEFTLHGQVLPPPAHDPLADRKETLKYLWVLMRGEGERGDKKEEHWGKPGWLVEGFVSDWLRFIWPEVSGTKLGNLATWCTAAAARYEGFVRLGEARERHAGEKNAPGLYFVADDWDTDVVPQYEAKKARPTPRPAKEVAGAMAQIAELKDAVAKAERERDEWVVECDNLVAKIEQASIDGINTDLRDQTIAQRRELEALREESERLRRALADRDATIRAMDDKLAATQEEFVVLKAREGHGDCVPEDLFRNVERENRALDRKLGLLGKHLDLASEVLKG